MRLLYVIGEPGSGKSTLVRQLVLGKRRRVEPKPFAHTIYEDGIVQLGRERGSGFSGTDALSMSVGPTVLAALESGAWPRVLGEGDRLSYIDFFDGARKRGYDVMIVCLSASANVMESRSAARAENGQGQDERWRRGRRTKVLNLLDALRSGGHAILELDTSDSTPLTLVMRIAADPITRPFFLEA